MGVWWRCVGRLRRSVCAGRAPLDCEPRRDASEDAGSRESPDESGGAWPRRVVSGLQPSGALHVGNYFGALRRLVRAQDDGDDVVVFIADLHALTAGTNSTGLADSTLEIATVALAAGIDPARTVLCVQSAVGRHADLCWVLGCLTTPHRLRHLPQYVERADAGSTGLGVMLYPVLQAADILLYRGTHVPVGIDQVPHLQLAAQLARAFNRRYGPCFPSPRAWMASDGSDRVLSLRRPEHKMSKSDPDPKSRILLTDSDEEISHKLRKAVTDCTPAVEYCPSSRPGVSNLVRLHCLATDRQPDQVVEESKHLTTAEYKTVVAAALSSSLRGLRARAAELHRRPRVVRAALQAGAGRARSMAEAVYTDAAARLGLLQPALPLLPDEKRETSENEKVQQKTIEVQRQIVK